MPQRGYVYILASQRNGTLYIEVTSNLIQRERRLKKWNRTWKLELIEKENPAWLDLYEQIAGSPGSPLSRG